MSLLYSTPTLFAINLPVLILLIPAASNTMSLCKEWDGSVAKMNYNKCDIRIHFISLFTNINSYLIIWFNFLMQLHLSFLQCICHFHLYSSLSLSCCLSFTSTTCSIDAVSIFLGSVLVGLLSSFPLVEDTIMYIIYSLMTSITNHILLYFLI